MEIKCKYGCDQRFFNVIQPLGLAVLDDGSFNDTHLTQFDLVNEELEKYLECPNCGGEVTITG